MKHAYLDGDTPVMFTDTHAVQFISGEWKPLDHADAHFKAGMLSEAEFKKMFGDLPPLPKELPLKP